MKLDNYDFGNDMLNSNNSVSNINSNSNININSNSSNNNNNKLKQSNKNGKIDKNGIKIDNYNKENSNELSKYIICPKCKTEIKEYKNPIPTADVIIEIYNSANVFQGIVLIERKNYPFGWALPGGFIEYGESTETSAVREAKEETSLDVRLLRLFNVYSNPNRDPRHHTITLVYVANVISGELKAADDAKNIAVYNENNLPELIAFDHRNIIIEYFNSRE